MKFSRYVAVSVANVSAFLPHSSHDNRCRYPLYPAKVDVSRKNGVSWALRLQIHKMSGNDDGDQTTSDDNTSPVSESESPAPPKKKNIWQTVFDPIVTSPILPLFLFWGPFFQNPYNKRKWAELTANANPILLNAGLATLASLVVGYFVYNARVEAAEEASERRELALRDLRAARQGQFTSNKNKQTSTEIVEAAAAAYEDALREELQLRQMMPNIDWRLDFPDDPASREEDKAAARQFLNLEITEDGNIIELDGDR